MIFIIEWYRRQDWRQSSEAIRHNRNVILAFLLFILAQLLSCAFDQPFWRNGLDFPGQIVAMVAIWVFMWAIQDVCFKPGKGLEGFYYSHLKAPTDILNKNMSIGFTVPVMAMIRDTPASVEQGALIAAAFIVTGLLNSALVYSLAHSCQILMTKIKLHRRCKVSDIEASPDQQPTTAPLTPPRRRADLLSERSRKCISDVSTLNTQLGYISDSNTPNQTPASQSCQHEALRPLSEKSTRHQEETSTTAHRSIALTILGWVKRNIFITLSAVSFFLVGLPVAYSSPSTASVVPLDTAFLFFTWLLFSAAQASTKTSSRLRNHPKWCAGIATMLNPVLWTSILLIVYAKIQSMARHWTIKAVIDDFVTNVTLSNFICGHIDSINTTSPNYTGTFPFGAGDIASSILNAGIVGWGLKLFEYRRELWSRGGATVFIVSAAASILNIVLWPLLAHKIGVGPASRDLSFAARSVTIALGGPVMTTLGGDAGLNAVGVVVNGLVFQLAAGAGMGVWLKDVGERWKNLRIEWLGKSLTRVRGSTPTDPRPSTGEQVPGGVNNEARYSSDATHVNEPIHHRGPGIATPAPTIDDNLADHRRQDDVTTIVAGVTIGINAAAMGTATLYEQQSHAAPYSALAMTVFGVFTVLFTLVPQLNVWLIARVSGS